MTDDERARLVVLFTSPLGVLAPHTRTSETSSSLPFDGRSALGYSTAVAVCGSFRVFNVFRRKGTTTFDLYPGGPGLHHTMTGYFVVCSIYLFSV